MVAEISVAAISHEAVGRQKVYERTTQQDLYSRLQLLRMFELQGLARPSETDEFRCLAILLISDLERFDTVDKRRAEPLRSRLDRLVGMADSGQRWTLAGTLVNDLNRLMWDSFDSDPKARHEGRAPAFVPPKGQRVAFVLIGAVLLALLGTRLLYARVFMDHLVFPYRLTRLADLEKLRNALGRYHADRGVYPISADGGTEFSGKLWGAATADSWLPGLAPEYFDALPVDPRGGGNPYRQYVYRSDGRDYKLLSLVPEDCLYTVEKRPELSDPARNVLKQCYAYGFWTSGAEKW
jgi:hypothetical protein